MNGFSVPASLRGTTGVYKNALLEIAKLYHKVSTIKILVVVDGGLALSEPEGTFGVGRVVRLLRESSIVLFEGSGISVTHFEVDTARRESTGEGNETYLGFRFDQTAGRTSVLNQYHEVWCFGFQPGNSNGPDSDIQNGNPLTGSELTALTRWMNKQKGGVLAMGDHDFLGASMCHQIPRVRSMRRWTNAQGVPPQFTPIRHDTNRPVTPGQHAGTERIPNSVEEDWNPQPIEWVAWVSQQLGPFRVRRRPHPILCHPTYGPINVLPDHPHEGWCYDDHEIDLTAQIALPGLTGDEYPSFLGFQPRPQVIAYGNTTQDPPHWLEKGDSNAKRFPMINVYDGHPAKVGRVVTDSTWHHWFDMNILQIEQAGTANWEMISRYYLNVAMWLAPPEPITVGLSQYVLFSHFMYPGIEEYSRNASVFELGKTLYDHLTRVWGPCWVTTWIFDKIWEIDSDMWAWLKDRLFWKNGIPFPGGDPCISCPPFEYFEIAILGGLVRASFPIAEDIRKQALNRGKKGKLKLDQKKLLNFVDTGVKEGLSEMRRVLSKSQEQVNAII